MKKAILSIDVEDWYHLDYFNRQECDTSYSMLDGLDVYIDILESMSVTSSFFVLGEIADNKVNYFKDLVSQGYDIGSHGWDHQRPLTMSLSDFQLDLNKCFNTMKNINGTKGFGYRAPCFSLDDKRLEIVKNTGFDYDSSRIEFGNHSLYGSIDMSEYFQYSNSIYHKDNFSEFEVSTSKILGKNIPISGGGYLRIFPWAITKNLIKSYLKDEDIYILYIHPFELSQYSLPNLPSSTSYLTNFRCKYGRKKVAERIKSLIELLHSYDYEFTTFSAVHEELAKVVK